MTRGTGVFYSRFAEYKPYAGVIRSRTNGVLIAQEEGLSNAYALFSLQERGALMIGAGVSVYGGMIVGEHSRDNDLTVNPCKTKKLTNIRTHRPTRSGPTRRASHARVALEFINADELVESRRSPSACASRSSTTTRASGREDAAEAGAVAHQAETRSRGSRRRRRSRHPSRGAPALQGCGQALVVDVAGILAATKMPRSMRSEPRESPAIGELCLVDGTEGSARPAARPGLAAGAAHAPAESCCAPGH